MGTGVIGKVVTGMAAGAMVTGTVIISMAVGIIELI
jgi:hypothetical protein